MRDPREYFPGDPPFGEWFVVLLGVTGACLLLSFGVDLLRKRHPGVWLVATAVLAVGIVGSFVMNRQRGPWRVLQATLVTFEAEVRQVLKQCHQDRECAIRYLDERYGTTKVQLTPEHDPVRLFVWHNNDHPVAVDFGHGATAVFDTGWMFTVYTD